MQVQAATGFALHGMETESPEHLVTLEGTVTAMDWNPHFDVSVDIRLTAANGTNYRVELAPPWWWAEQHFLTNHVNDTLKVEGALDDGHELQAFTVWINGGNAIVFRSVRCPRGLRSESGQTGEDHDNENGTEDSGSE